MGESSLTQRDVASGLAALLLESPQLPYPPQAFRRVVVDSRLAGDGDLFVALPGERVDGHAFIPDALRSGATGVLARRWPDGLPPEVRARTAFFPVADPLRALQHLAAAWRGRWPVRTVGVTGSVGKTSTKEAVAAVLSRRYCVLKSTGNLNTEIGLPLVLLQLNAQHQRAVLEMGMYDLGDIRLLCRMARPEIGVVTNIGPSHLERLGSMERIADAKAELVESLPPDGIAVLNADDPLVAALAHRTAARVVTYGRTPEADCHAAGVQPLGLDGLAFSLFWQGQQVHVRTPLLGAHSVYTCLAAAAAGLIEGLPLDGVGRALRDFRDGNRIQVRRLASGVTLLDDTYNASPSSMKAALALLAQTPGRRIAVLGDMLELGSYEEAGHLEVGRCAAAAAGLLVTVGPRGRLIARAAREAGLARVIEAEEPAEAAHLLRSLTRSGDFVLIKASRSMGLERIVDQLLEESP